MSKISRRDFLKGSGAAALSAALVGLTGCAKEEGTPTPTPEAVHTPAPAPGSTAPVQDKLYTAYINPQREDYRSNTKELKTLFSPLKIGAIQLNHRMVKSAAGSATYLAGPTDEFLQYYVNLAKGGVELIYVESVAWLEPPADGSGYTAEMLGYGKNLVAECAKYGASLAYQISGFGMGENDMTVDQIHAQQDRYVAIAKGDVPRKHWRHLSRALVAKDGYRGMASWSGSMFEYLMPELFLPLCRDSLLYETAKFCVYVQRKRPPKGVPWGISESAFFSLDTALNYRYKAHGCAALALKRGMECGKPA